mgnify:CR=1 FL=1
MSHPKVAISPITAPNQPYALKLGTKLLLTLTIENSVDGGQNYQLMGSHLADDCYTLGVPTMSANHNHYDQIEVLIHPLQEAAVGEHQLQLALQSEKGDVIWEDSVYLEFLAADNIEIMLTPDQATVEDGVGLYQLSIINVSDVERTLNMQPKGLPVGNGCSYRTDPEQITLAPDQTQTVDLMVQPQRWWLRPWFGNGRIFRFQVDLEDTNGTPLPQLLARGTLVWQPYPRSRSVKLLSVLLFTLATSYALLWYSLLRRQAGPTIAALNASQGIVPQSGQKDIQLSWTIKDGQKLSKLVLAREGKDGPEVAKTFWFNKGIPPELQRTQANQTTNFCQYEQLQPSVLKCNGIATDTTDAGKYQFRLQAFSKNGSSSSTDTKLTSLMAFEPNAVPKIVKFYAPNSRTQTSASGPVATASAQGPVNLSWEIVNPGQLTEVQVMTVDANNAEAALVQRYSFQGGKIPTNLAKYCTFNQSLTCQNVPTAARQPGQYFFKLDVSYQQTQQSSTVSKTIGPMTIQAEPLKIASFQINGQKAPAKYVLPVGQNTLDLAWKVVGGNNPKVKLLPNSEPIPVAGSVQIELNPQNQGPITLQAIDRNGKQVEQTVKIERNPSLASIPSPQSAPIEVASAQSQSSPELVQPQVPASQLPLVWPDLASSPPARQSTLPKPTKSQPVKTAASKPEPQYSKQSFEEAQNVTRGLVVARQKGKIILNGNAWNKTQDAITLLRRGYSREEAAKRADVDLWKLDILVSLGAKAK